MSKRIFDSVEDINKTYGTNVEIPNNLPEGCNVICYVVNDLYNVEFFHPYSLNESLYYYDTFGKRWEWASESLEQKVVDDEIVANSEYIYLHLNESVKFKDKFTPERLLGVETAAGYIKDVNFTKGFKPEITTIQLSNGHWYCPPSLNFYISDDFDETVSLDEYIKLFYNVDSSS